MPTPRLPPSEQQRLAVRARPDQTPVMHMRWDQLLFLHWSFDPTVIQSTLPPGLHVDTHEGRAWVGLVPFFMRDVRPIGLPAVPVLSDFLEVNVRTYVYNDDGVPGVWFYSLDCDQPVAVEAARRLFHLNYRHAEMSASHDAATGDVALRTKRRDQPAAHSHFRYRAGGRPRRAEVGSLEFFLVERYVLFAYDAARERVGAGRVSHEPYEIRDAQVDEYDAALLEAAGLKPARSAYEHACATHAQAVAATRVVFE